MVLCEIMVEECIEGALVAEVTKSVGKWICQQ
jgi:hypothetical protein